MPMTDIPPTVRYALTESPIGPLLVAATDEKIVQVAFENQDFERILHQLKARYGGAVERNDKALEFATDQLAEYFAGTRKTFELTLASPVADRFIEVVQHHLAAIPYGETRTYGQLATELGRPGAARAVGSACARNPLPLLQPCHRVIRSDGTPGEFSGTPRAKQYLLAFEAGEHPESPTS